MKLPRYIPRVLALALISIVMLMSYQNCGQTGVSFKGAQLDSNGDLSVCQMTSENISFGMEQIQTAVAHNQMVVRFPEEMNMSQMALVFNIYTKNIGSTEYVLHDKHVQGAVSNPHRFDYGTSLFDPRIVEQYKVEAEVTSMDTAVCTNSVIKYLEFDVRDNLLGGQYEWSCRCGDGSMGSAHTCYDTANDQNVADSYCAGVSDADLFCPQRVCPEDLQ